MTIDKFIQLGINKLREKKDNIIKCEHGEKLKHFHDPKIEAIYTKTTLKKQK